MKIVVAAGGRFHALHLAHQLEKKNVLKKLFTTCYSKQDKEYVSNSLVCNNNFLKNINLLFHKLKFSKFINKSDFYVFKDNIFDFWLNKKLDKIGHIDIFVGWAHFFLKSLSKIKKSGAKVIVECGSCHILEQQNILKDEYERFGIKLSPINEKNISKILSEYELSDYIMTCSDFTYNSFIKHGINFKKILKVPYGVNLDLFFNEKEKNKNLNNKKFRVICVGMMCLRKGIPYLLKAWENLKIPKNEIELLLVGNIQNDLKQVLKNLILPSNIIFYGAVDRKTIVNLYKSSSLFVLPSIEEGLSMTIAEAMACELPVICTTNTGGQELIDNGVEGFIIPIRDSKILSEKITWCYENREEAENMGILGKKKVRNFSWDVYGQRIIDIYKKILQE